MRAAGRREETMDSNCSVAVVFNRGRSRSSLVSLRVWDAITAGLASERVWVSDRATQLVDRSAEGDDARVRRNGASGEVSAQSTAQIVLECVSDCRGWNATRDGMRFETNSEMLDAKYRRTAYIVLRVDANSFDESPITIINTQSAGKGPQA
jgi:hypothetical protein